MSIETVSWLKEMFTQLELSLQILLAEKMVEEKDASKLVTKDSLNLDI